jgi:hypothetical protein
VWVWVQADGTEIVLDPLIDNPEAKSPGHSDDVIEG